MESVPGDGEGRINVSALYEEYRRRAHTAPAPETDAAKAYAENAFDRNGMRNRVVAHRRRQLAIESILHNIGEEHTEDLPPTRSRNRAIAIWAETFITRRAAMPLALASFVLCLLVLPYLTVDRSTPGEVSQEQSVAATANGYPLDVRMGRFISPPVAGDGFSLSAQEAVERNLYAVGVVSTQLNVAVAANDKTLVSAYFSYLDTVPEVSAEPGLANLLSHSVAQLSSTGEISNDSHVSVQRLLTSLADGQDLSQWFVLGKNTESLRLALLLSAETGDTGSIDHLQPILQWPSEERYLHSNPRLQSIVTDIRSVVEGNGNLSRLQQRYLLDQIELVNVLLR